MENLSYDLDGNELNYEIIGGEKIYMAAAAPNLDHGTISGRIYFEFLKYIIDNNVKAAVFNDNTDVYFSVKDHFMPDVSVVCDLEIIRARKKILGTPDLVVEVLSESTMKNDLGKKKNAYEKYGVKEYWIVDPWAKRIEVYHLIDTKFQLDNVYKLYSDDEDVKPLHEIKVSIFDGLVIDIRNVFKWWLDE